MNPDCWLYDGRGLTPGPSPSVQLLFKSFAFSHGILPVDENLVPHDLSFPLAMACSWQPELVERAASVAAKEASIAGVHVTFSPMADLARDARWGRNVEGAAPLLTLPDVAAPLLTLPLVAAPLLALLDVAAPLLALLDAAGLLLALLDVAGLLLTLLLVAGLDAEEAALDCAGLLLTLLDVVVPPLTADDTGAGVPLLIHPVFLPSTSLYFFVFFTSFVRRLTGSPSYRAQILSPPMEMSVLLAFT